MKPASPLAQQLLQRAAIFMLCFAVVALSWQLFAGYQARQQWLRQVPATVQRQLMPLLAQAVWNMDQLATRELLSSLLHQQGIVQVTLRDPQGSAVQQLGSARDISHVVELPVVSERTGSQSLGLLQLGLSHEILEQPLLRDMLYNLLLLLLAIAGCTLVLYRLLRQRVLQPLAQLSRELALQTNSDAEHADEVQHLSAALQQLQQLQHRYELHHQHQEAELAHHRDHLSELVAQRTAELEHLSRFQHLISELSTRFINLPLAELHHEVDAALARIGMLLEVDRCYLFRVTPALTIHDNQEWCQLGIASTAHFYEDYPIAQSRWFIPQLVSKQLLAFSRLDEIPQEGHSERERFAEHGIGSIAVVTLSHQGQLLGFFGCDAVGRQRDWLDKELALMRVVSEMLSNVLLRKQHMQALEAAQQALAQANEKLVGIANTDGLTGLANRRLFDLRKTQEYATASQRQQPLSLLLLDVDLFKAYNDCFGHIEGDQCLIRLAGLLQQQFATPEQLPARIGGEEFAVLLPGVTAADAMLQAEALRQAIWALGIPHLASPVSTHVTVSIGVATLDSGRHGSFDELHAEADANLYRAKNLGRNRVIGRQTETSPA